MQVNLCSILDVIEHVNLQGGCLVHGDLKSSTISYDEVSQMRSTQAQYQRRNLFQAAAAAEHRL